MPTDDFDAVFRGSTGLADDFDAVFTNVAFVKDPGYTDNDQNPIPILTADLQTDDSGIGEGGVIENQFFPIGNGWDIVDGGKAVEVQGGKVRGFNVNTYAQKIVARLLELDLPAVKARFEEIGSGPQTAAFWEGLNVHLEQETYTTGGFKGRDGNMVEKRERSQLMPTSLLGWVAEEKGAKAAPVAKKAAAKKAAAKAPAKSKPEAAEPETDVADDLPTGDLTPYAVAKSAVDADIVAAIEAIASEAADADSFMETAYATIDGIDADENIQTLVDDVDSDDSIWAIACAG